MSGKFLRTLSKIGLVELSEDEEKNAPETEKVDMAAIDAQLASEETGDVTWGRDPQQGHAPAPRAASPRAPTPAPQVSMSTGSEIDEGRDFSDLYAMAGVPPAEYAAEKLLKLLEGLRAMDAATRKAAVVAMDQADEKWTLADVVMDATRKIKTLEGASASLDAEVAQIRASAEAEITKREDFAKQATEKIQEEIAKLQKMLGEELGAIESQKAEFRASIDNAASAAIREKARLTAEIERLREVPTTFGSIA